MKGAKSLELAWDREQEPVFPTPPPNTHTRTHKESRQRLHYGSVLWAYPGF